MVQIVTQRSTVFSYVKNYFTLTSAERARSRWAGARQC